MDRGRARHRAAQPRPRPTCCAPTTTARASAATAAKLASVAGTRRPRFYDLETADGVPYWKIALLHLDSFASTVVQTCSYWGNDDQCKFCGIGVSLDAGRTIVKKSPEQLAEVAMAAKELDGAVDATLTTGSSNGVDRGARYVARCGHAVKEATGLPVEVQFEPPMNLDVIDEVADLGIDSVGIHVESFDPAVLARVAPAKARTGIDQYFRAWERAVARFGEGQVSTYVILGMGEDPELTVEGCRRAIDIGVFPFVVPIRPVAGSLMEDVVPPAARVHRAHLPQGRRLHQRAGHGRRDGQGRLCALPGVFGAQRRAAGRLTAPVRPRGARHRAAPPADRPQARLTITDGGARSRGARRRAAREGGCRAR